ncbi:MAG TPA: hypothetical protein VM389_09705, partial [Phycisphaerae bacterium]|nr:hypothetical protein [Phycisphaerae bacterium]
FANIDDSIVLFWFPACLAARWLLGYLEDGDRRALLLAAVVGGLQVLFSVYVFFYQSLALLLILVFHARRIAFRRDRIHLLAGTLVYLAIPAATIVPYIMAARDGGYTNPFGSLSVLHAASLGIADLGRALPENMVYPSWPDPRQEFGFWVLVRRHAFAGVALWCLAAWGAMDGRRGRSMLLALAALGLFLAMGPFIQVREAVGYSPLYFIHKWIPQTAFLRVPLRGFFLTLLALSLLAARGMDRLLSLPVFSSGRRVAIVAVALMAIHVAENAPMPARGYAGSRYATPPSGYLEVFEGRRGDVVLDLPTSTGTDFSASGDDLFPYNREIIYMNWQTSHGQNIMGGVNGYYPRHRLGLQPLVDRIPRLVPLASLALAGLTHIACHKKMLLPGERDPLPSLDRSRFLKKIFEDDAIAVFSLDLERMRDAAELVHGTRDLETLVGTEPSPAGGFRPGRPASAGHGFVPSPLRR